MNSISREWNIKQAKLKKLLINMNQFEEAIRLCLELHGLVHASEVNGSSSETYEDMLWKDLSEQVFRLVPENKNRSIAWNMWHITRIEDITANILIADDRQVFDKTRMKKMTVGVADTGNAMKFEETRDFSERINMNELRKYRSEVGKKTAKIIKKLRYEDLKRKFEKEQTERILHEGGVLNIEGSIWLLDFWGRKTVAGILLMPITRHQIGHINDSFRIKDKYARKKKL